MRRLLLILALFLPDLAFAQVTPVLRTELEKTEAVPGQPIILRVTVLVPTWFPKPPVFPSFEIPDVMVRLPQRASGPVSETIEGETWSGISRAYRIYPLAPGDFVIPAQKIELTVANPDAGAPDVIALMTDEFSFKGVVPPGAEDLDPFIAAEALEIEQQVEGEVADLAPGDAVGRSLTAKLTGASPVFLPPLLPQEAPDGLSAYADEPVLEEKSDRGTLSGTRKERVSYVVKRGGSFELAPISLRWFNLKTNSVEMIEVEGVEIEATSVSATESSVASRTWIFALITVALLGLLLRRPMTRLISQTNQKIQQLRDRYIASEHYAFRRAKRAIETKSYPDTLSAIDEWWRRAAPNEKNEPEVLVAALLRLGASKFSRAPGDQEDSADWGKLAETLETLRRNIHRGGASEAKLAPLNPIPHSWIG